MALPSPRYDTCPSDEEEAIAHDAYAFRYSYDADGEFVVEQVPLTLDVLLNPRGDEEVVQNPQHVRTLGPLESKLRDWLEREPDVVVLSDTLLRWGIPGVRNVGPDVAVFRGVRDRERLLKDQSFDVRAAGVLPCLVVEVVSPTYKSMRDKDEVHNKELYARLGIEELVWVYPQGFREPMRIEGYRLGSRQKRYRRIRPDARGRVLSQTTGLFFSMDPGTGEVIVEDQATGERLLSREEAVELARQEAQARRKAEEELARLREEMQRRSSG